MNSRTSPYDNPATTSLLRPFSFDPNVKITESFHYFVDPVNATTSLWTSRILWPNGCRVKGVPLYLRPRKENKFTFICT